MQTEIGTLWQTLYDTAGELQHYVLEKREGDMSQEQLDLLNRVSHSADKAFDAACDMLPAVQEVEDEVEMRMLESKAPKFNKTSCSHCGKTFGPGNHCMECENRGYICEN